MKYIKSYKFWLIIGACVVIVFGACSGYFGLSTNNNTLTTLISAGLSLAVMMGLITNDLPTDGSATGIKSELTTTVENLNEPAKQIG